MGRNRMAPGATAIAPGAGGVDLAGATHPHRAIPVSVPSPGVLFEQPHRGDLWRLEVATLGGRTFGNWRRWYMIGGEWKPTKAGVTIPLERLAELEAALSGWRHANAPEAAPRGS